MSLLEFIIQSQNEAIRRGNKISKLEQKTKLVELAKEAVKLIKKFIEIEAYLGECAY